MLQVITYYLVTRRKHKAHNESMAAMNKEIESRNSLKAKQQEQLDANLSEISNAYRLNA